MANKKNKVKFNICNVHYAPITVAEEGTVSFGTPVPMPGAVSISMDPTGEPESFYADGIEYYVINNNQGYDGDLCIRDSIKARPMADGYVKAKTGDSTTETVYNNWYKSVYLPAASTAEQQSAKSTKSVS